MPRGPKISLARLSWEGATTRKHFEGSGKYPKRGPHEHRSKNHIIIIIIIIIIINLSQPSEKTWKFINDFIILGTHLVDHYQ